MRCIQMVQHPVADTPCLAHGRMISFTFISSVKSYGRGVGMKRADAVNESLMTGKLGSVSSAICKP